MSVKAVASENVFVMGSVEFDSKLSCHGSAEATDVTVAAAVSNEGAVSCFGFGGDFEVDVEDETDLPY
jgi:hypothetical protein